MKKDILKREKHIISFLKTTVGRVKYVPFAEKILAKIKENDWYHGIWLDKEVKELWNTYHNIKDSMIFYTGISSGYNSKQEQNIFECFYYLMIFFTINEPKKDYYLGNIDEVINYS